MVGAGSGSSEIPGGGEQERALFAKSHDPAKMARLWERIVKLAGQARRGGDREMDAALVGLLNPLPNPERCLLHLDRFLEASLNPPGMAAEFAENSNWLEVFFRLTAVSSFIAEILVRDAQLFRYTVSSGILDTPRSPVEYLALAMDAVAPYPPDKQIQSLRRFHRREMLYIAAADILGKRTLEEATLALSGLADAVLSIVLRRCIEDTAVRLGTGVDTGICILALGKHGGKELNYSSDIDIMILYREDTEIGGVSAFDAASRIVESLVQTLTAKTTDGFFYRTDLRLRPDGSAGAPALSVHSALHYYESRGTLWERQMLYKARYCAGERQTAEAFFKGLTPYLYPRTLAAPPRAVLDDVRRRLELRAPSPENVKHMPGGIRYIEFSVQALQVIHAAAMPELREPNTLRAIDALERALLLTEDEALALGDAYRFYRKCEHLLQLERFEQTHSIPREESEQRELAWKMGFMTAAELHTVMDGHKRQVLRVFYNIFDPRAMERGEQPLVSPEQYSLPALGFANPVAALNTLKQFTSGRIHNPHSASMRRRIEEALGGLLVRISREPDPDQCLQSLELALSVTASPETFLPLLQSFVPGSILLRIASVAPAFLRHATAVPGLLETAFGGEDPETNLELPMDAMKRAMQLRYVGFYLLGEMPFRTFALHETRTADWCVRRVFEQTLARSDARFIVVAFGKYGGREQSFGSDLDIVIIHDSEGVPQQDVIAAAAQFESELRRLSGYEIDTRVRPEGGKGLAAISLDAYREYFAKRAANWERQALLRARVVAGDTPLGNSFDVYAAGQIDALELNRQFLDEMMTLRMRSEPEARRSGKQFNVKRSPGGLMDTEYAAQLFLLYAKGAGLTGVVPGNTFEALDALAAAAPELEFRFLRLHRHYLLLRRAQTAIRLLFDRTSNALPSSSSQIRQLARALGFAGADEFQTELASAQRDTREDMTAIVEYIRKRN